MRRFLIPIVALALVFGVAAVGMAAVANTPHDVQVMTGIAGLEPCAMCHTPHTGSGAYPLWNRTGTTTGYTMYASPSMDMTVAVDLQAPSTNCMVCHNGLVSNLVNYPGPSGNVNGPNANYDFTAGEINAGLLNGQFINLTQVMTDDHPVSFTYDPTVDEDNNAFPLTTDLFGNGRRWIPTGAANFPLYGATGNQFECATCHDVHDTIPYLGKQLTGGNSAGTQVFFLRADNRGSAMCSGCHILR